MLALAAPDKYRGSLNAPEVAHAIAAGARGAGWECRELPLADGGEGTLDVFAGPNRTTRVSGPLGVPVEAAWRLDGGLAVIEAARACGLALTGGAAGNDAVAASTRGVGELIAVALAAGAEEVVVGVGGSATSDGGTGAVGALRAHAPFPVPVRVACDVQTLFLDAARVYGPQKGATPEQVRLLGSRLEEVAGWYEREFGVDVTALPGSGAAGGLAGGLAVLGAELHPGFEVVADAAGLDEALAGVDAVVTGEGKLDATSFAGKVVGGVLDVCLRNGLRAVVVAGEVDWAAPGVPPTAVSLVERFGRGRAWAEPAKCVAVAVRDALG